MDYNTLNEIVGRLFSHFRMKHPGADTLEWWLDDIGHIPADAGDWIVKKICREQDSLPRNVTKIFQDLWRAYLAEHPDKAAKLDPVFCEVCCGKGLIWFQFQLAGFPYRATASVRCGHCDNHEILGISPDVPRMTAGELVRNGAELDRRNRRRKSKDDFVSRGQSLDFGKLVKINTE